jgi:hypothetical protein
MFTNFFKQVTNKVANQLNPDPQFDDETLPSRFSEHRRDEIATKIAKLQEEQVILDNIAKLTFPQKVECLFTLLDRNQDGNVSVAELAEGLRRMLDVSFEKSIDMAVEEVDKNDKLHINGKIEAMEFEPVMKSLAKTLKLPIRDLIEQLILETMVCEEKSGLLARFETYRRDLTKKATNEEDDER